MHFGSSHASASWGLSRFWDKRLGAAVDQKGAAAWDEAVTRGVIERGASRAWGFGGKFLWAGLLGFAGLSATMEFVGGAAAAPRFRRARGA
jgi:hypothetical protein